MEHSKNKYLIYDNYTDLDAGAAKPLIEKMILHDPKCRPTIGEIHKHPLLWNTKKRVDFIHVIFNN